MKSRSTPFLLAGVMGLLGAAAAAQEHDIPLQNWTVPQY